jgi:hypothetical protein
MRADVAGVLAGGRHRHRAFERSRAQHGHLLSIRRREHAEIQNRARALDNNVYDTFGGRSSIINYRGQIVGKQDYGAGSTYVGGVVDIEALRDHRARAQGDNWLKDLRTELYQILCETPIYPKNLYLERARR